MYRMGDVQCTHDFHGYYTIDIHTAYTDWTAQTVCMCQEHMTDATLTQPWSSITSQTVHSSLVYYTCDILHKDYACGIYARCGFHFGMLLIVPYIVKGLYYLQYTISACLKLQHAKEPHMYILTLSTARKPLMYCMYTLYTPIG